MLQQTARRWGHPVFWLWLFLCLGSLGLVGACDGVLGEGNTNAGETQTESPTGNTENNGTEPTTRPEPPSQDRSGTEPTTGNEPSNSEEKGQGEESVNTPDDAGTGTPEQTLQDNSTQDTTPPPDNTTPPKKCGDTTFKYDTQGKSVTAVFVAGSFNGWNPQADAMKNTQGSVWEITINLKEGSHQYKFVVDGNWINDPNNSNQTPDGVGGFNNVITVAPCNDPQIQVASHNTQSGTFTATLNFVPGASGAGLAGSPKVTIDRKVAPAGSVTTNGNTIKLNLSNLPKGIHDIRVDAQDSQGNIASQKLLKVYVGVSKDWRDVALYFVMIDRFVNGDTSNDSPFSNTPKLLNYMGGDFKGLAQKIDDGYFDKMGINALWITWPIDNPNHPEKGSYPKGQGCGLSNKAPNLQWVNTNYTGFHGYWPADLNKIEEHFGTLQDLQDVVDKAHKRGIRILLDFTVNHVHMDSAAWKNGKDKGHFNTPAKICNDVGWDNFPIVCWFVSYLPDINYKNPTISKIMLDHVVYWVKQTGADGLRIDALKHIEQSFIRAIRKRTTAEFEGTGVDFYMVGETFTGDTGLIKKFVGPDQVHGQFDFPLNMQILQAFAKGSTGLLNMHNSAKGIMNTYGNGALMSTFIGNHDIARFISLANGDTCGPWDVFSNQVRGWTNPPGTPSQASPYNKMKLAFAYIFALPGIPLVYYGDEFGMPGAGDPDNRRMMRFGSQLNNNEQTTLSFLQKLGKARQDHEVLRRGAIGPTHVGENDVIVFSRTHSSGTAIVVLNRGSSRNLSFGVSAIGLKNGDTLKDVLGSNSVTVSNNNVSIQVPAQTAAIYIK